SLGLVRDLGERAGGALCLEGLAAAEAPRGQALAAARRWGAASRRREEIGSSIPPNERPRYERRVAGARAAVNDDCAFEAAWAEGRAMTLEQAIELALEPASD